MAALPTTGISTSMVRNAIGASTNDVGALCTHPNINMWSIHKPVQWPTEIGLTEPQFTSVNMNYGILFAEMSPHNGVGYYLCVYQKPLGGANSPCRIGDFRGYNHNALPEMYIKDIPAQVNKFLTNSITSNFENTINAEIPFTDISFIPDSPIEYPDGTPVQHVYELFMGCEVRNSSGLVKEVFSTTAIDINKIFTLPVYDLPVGSYELAFFLFAPNATSRRFPFPHTPLYPNYKNISIIYNVPFVLSALRYSVTDINSYSYTIQENVTNNVPKLSSISLRATYTATETVTIDSRILILNVESDIFYLTGHDENTIIAKSPNVVEDGYLITIPQGGWITLNASTNINYYTGGDLYEDPYPVTYTLLYGAFEIDNKVFTFQNI